MKNYRKFPAFLRSPRLAPRLLVIRLGYGQRERNRPFLVIRTVLPHFIHQLAGIDVPFLCSHCFGQNLT